MSQRLLKLKCGQCGKVYKCNSDYALPVCDKCLDKVFDVIDRNKEDEKSDFDGGVCVPPDLIKNDSFKSWTPKQ